jgi:hypothetical protein
MGTASVEQVDLHLVPVLSIPIYFTAPVRHLPARISTVGLKLGSFGIAHDFDLIHYYRIYYIFSLLSRIQENLVVQ